MRSRVRTAASLAEHLPGLTGLDVIDKVARTFPMAISPYYLSLVRERTPSDPIFRQCVPQAAELVSPAFAQADPLHEEAHTPTPGLVHRYPNRALVMASSTCAMYCRHCTRKRLAGVQERSIDSGQVRAHVDYLRGHPEVEDLILSGGDPLTLSNRRLDAVLSAYRSVPTVRVVRMGTRIPVTMPMRVTESLVRVLARHQPLWVCTQFNHPWEISPQATQACDRLTNAGIPILNQTVLLRGVNDCAETLAELYSALIAIRVRPYYLFQCDLVRGVEDFRTPLSVGVEIMSALRRRISGIACPQFVVDAPNGAGKIPMASDAIVSTTETETVLRSPWGKLVTYPEPVGSGGLGSAERA